MFLREKTSGDLIAIDVVSQLVNPMKMDVIGRYQHGEEEQDPELFLKSDLVFPSGEALPQCWLDSLYREKMN